MFITTITIILITISFGCMKEPIENKRFKCLYCFDFNLCEECFIKRDKLSYVYATSHKNYHSFKEYVL